ncbi:MAG TPA: prevent-host-death protein [Gammaproteobacteria bacterium]|nr:prevent-host-death protein [Gammaproteobacteria bacterium]
MTITTLSSREFNHDTGRAKRAAQVGPVFITDRGRPALVLLTIDAYHALQQPQISIVDLLAMPKAAEIEFEPPRLDGRLFQPADIF